MTLIANAHLVSLVREAKGWTQSELAERANVTQGFISKVENGFKSLEGEQLTQVANALECPEVLLASQIARRGLEVSCMFNRRRQSQVSVMTAKKIEAISHLTRLTVDGLLKGVDVTPTVPFQRMDIDDFDNDPEYIAQLMRARMRIPSGPIDNVFNLLDSAGIVAVVRPVGTDAQDAFSTWPPDGTPVMVINTGLSVDRMRFTAVHELGHIILHVMPNKQQEEQADRFAAEFLMPAIEIRPSLEGLTTRDFNRLMGLKAEWKVSIAALIQRAKTLETISERQFREFRIKLSKLGWHRFEPITLPDEQPTLLNNVINLHRNEHQYTENELAALALMTPEAFRRHYLRDFGRPDLKVV